MAVVAAVLLAAACTGTSDGQALDEYDQVLDDYDEHEGFDEYVVLPAEVSFDGATASYSGELSEENVASFVDKADRHGTAVTKLVINSEGGDTVAGRAMGRWVHENNVAVEVDELCFSSCANYVFTAAPTKTIRADAIVGWHGSDQQDRFIIVDDSAAAEAECRDEPLPPGADTGWDYSDEVEFLAEIGVRVDALVWGMSQAERCERYLTLPVTGWTFTIEDMAKLDIGDVTYLGTGEYPSQTAVTRYEVAVFDVD